MPISRVDKFRQEVNTASVSVADFTRILGAADRAFAEIQAEAQAAGSGLETLSRTLAELERRQARYNKQATELRTAGAPDYLIAGKEKQAARFNPRIDQLRSESEALKIQLQANEAEKRAIINLAPTQEMLSAARAIETLDIKYNRLGQTLERLRNLGPYGAAGVATVQEQMRTNADMQRLNFAKISPWMDMQQTLGGADATRTYENRQRIATKISDLEIEKRFTEDLNRAIPGTPGLPARIDAITAAIDRLTAAEARLASGARWTSPMQMGPNPQVNTNTADPRMQAWNSASNRERARALELARKEAELENLQRNYQADPRYAQAREIAEKKGFTQANLRSIGESGLSGIQKITYATKDLDGVNKSLTLFSDNAGRVLPSASRQFSTFASSVGRDLRELTKWSIAISLIYGPLRKLQEVVGLMIANEVKLADASIAVSDSTMTMGKIFDIANEAANAMGENVSDVITNFSEAYQATGGMGTTMERTAAATQLMNDALILSKLSSLSATQSIDTLASALRQSGMELNQGGELLDKWVKTTKIANVSLDTLATGFSVLGEAASTAGLSNDELNAVLAVTSETMGVTGREAANMARAFVAGFQSDKAVKALQSVGIATTDVNGEMRTLIELQQDLYYARLAGTISDATYSKLTLAIGGGTRRQAPTAGFIESAPRLQEIIAGQSGSAGAASTALAKQLDTVQTSMTRVQNAFQSLAQSLGDEGGLLDIFKVVLDLFTAVVDVSDKLFSSLGKTGPILAIALGAGAYISSQGPLWKSNLANKAGLGAMSLGFGSRGSQFINDTIMGGTQRPGNGLFGLGVSSERLTGIAGSALLAGVIPAMQNFSNYGKGTDRYGSQKGIADIAGSVGGAIAASFMGLSPIIGATLGQAIAESFVNNATRDLDLTKIGGKEVSGIFGADYTGTTAREKLAGSGFAGEAKQWAADMVSKSMWAAELTLGAMLPKGTTVTLPTTESILRALQTPEQKKAYDDWYAEQISSGAIQAEPKNRVFENATSQQLTGNQAYLDTIRKQREQEFLTQLTQGKMTPTAYTGKMETMGTFDERSTRFYAAFGQQLLDVSDDINTAEEAYSAFLDLFTYGNEEQIGSLTSMVTEVADLTNKIQALKEAGADPTKIKELEDEKARLENILATSANSMIKQASLEKYPVPNLINRGQPIVANMGTLGELYRRSSAAEAAYYTSPGLGEAQKTPEELDYMRQSFEDFAFGVEEGGQIVYYTISELAKKLGEGGDKIGSDWFQQELDKMVLEGKIEVKVDVASKSWGGEMEFPSSMAPLAQAWMDYATNMFEAMGLPVNRNEVQIVQYEDGQWGELRGEGNALQYMLGKIQETEQKQLEQGMWNIPEGATFWVPLQSGYYNKPSGGGGWNGQWPPETQPGGGGGAGGGGDTGGGNTGTPAPRENIPPRPGFVPPIEDNGQGNYYSNFPPTDKWKNWKKNLSLDEVTGEPSPKLKMELPGGPTGPELIRGILEGIRLLTVGSVFGAGNLINNQQAAMPAVPKMSLNLNTTTTITLDGRVLATAMKPYLLADITRAASALGKSSPQIS